MQRRAKSGAVERSIRSRGRPAGFKPPVGPRRDRPRYVFEGAGVRSPASHISSNLFRHAAETELMHAEKMVWSVAPWIFLYTPKNPIVISSKVKRL